MHSFFDALLIYGFDIDVAFKIHIFFFRFVLLFSSFYYFLGFFFYILYAYFFLFPGISQHIYVYLVIVNFFGLMCRC